MSGSRSLGFLLVGLLAVTGVGSSTVRTIDLGQHLHGLWLWEGRLYVNDYGLGITYFLSEEGAPQRTDLVPRGGMCDVLLKGDIVHAIGEQEREISRFDMRRGVWLQPVPLPPKVELAGLDIHGIEKIGETFWLIAAPSYLTALVPWRHRVLTWTDGSDVVRQYDYFGLDHELIGLQFYAGAMWTFQYGTGLLWQIELGETSFRLHSPWHLTEPIDDCASGGFRGFLLGGDEVVLTSITYSPETESSRLHFVPYPRGFPREP